MGINYVYQHNFGHSAINVMPAKYNVNYAVSP